MQGKRVCVCVCVCLWKQASTSSGVLGGLAARRFARSTLGPAIVERIGARPPAPPPARAHAHRTNAGTRPSTRTRPHTRAHTHTRARARVFVPRCRAPGWFDRPSRRHTCAVASHAGGVRWAVGGGRALMGKCGSLPFVAMNCMPNAFVHINFFDQNSEQASIAQW